MPIEIWLASCTGDGFDAQTWLALHTSIDVDGLYDLLEIAQVQQSWQHAAYLNAKLEAEREARLMEAKRR